MVGESVLLFVFGCFDEGVELVYVLAMIVHSFDVVEVLEVVRIGLTAEFDWLDEVNVFLFGLLFGN